MIFDFKRVNNITDNEIHSLIENKVIEQQHIDFKSTIETTDTKKIEFLRDIVSFVNGDGGYIIIGIDDDGEGHAAGYADKRIGEVEVIKQQIRSWCQDHIRERIVDLEIIARNVMGHPLIIVRIPASERKPHMVVCNNRTDFYVRDQDGKREMTIGEIREMFIRDRVDLKLTKIEDQLTQLCQQSNNSIYEKEIIKNIDNGSYTDLSTLNSSRFLVLASHRRFLKISSDKPYFRLTITPSDLIQNRIDINNEEITQLFLNPPGSRRSGWNMTTPYLPVKRIGMSLNRGSIERDFLELCSNGHMEFMSPIGELFYWKQSESEYKNRPRLYPYAVVEYPTTFLRLYHALTEKVAFQKGFQFSMYYRNIQGHRLLPYSPSSDGYMVPTTDVEPYQNKHIHIGPLLISSGEMTDKKAFDILSILYSHFGYDTDAIPFYDRENEKFIFPT